MTPVTIMAFRGSHCDKTYSYKSSLQTHEKVKHGGKRHTCHLCIKVYTSNWMKRKHLLDEHGIYEAGREQNLDCPECGKPYTREDYLEAHRKAEHFGTRYKCQFCNEKVYKYKRDLLKHIIRKHKKLKQGKDDWESVVENKVPMDMLSLEKRDSIRQYLLYLTTNKVVKY